MIFRNKTPKRLILSLFLPLCLLTLTHCDHQGYNNNDDNDNEDYSYYNRNTPNPYTNYNRYNDSPYNYSNPPNPYDNNFYYNRNTPNPYTNYNRYNDSPYNYSNPPNPYDNNFYYNRNTPNPYTNYNRYNDSPYNYSNPPNPYDNNFYYNRNARNTPNPYTNYNRYNGSPYNYSNPPNRYTTTHPLDQLDMSYRLNRGPFYNHEVIRLDRRNNAVILSAPTLIPPLGGTAPYTPIPGMPGAYSTFTHRNGTPAMEIYMPLPYVFHGPPGGIIKRLPNGQPLPGIPGGELPSVGIHLSKGNETIHLYLGKGAFAIYYPIEDYSWPVGLRFPIHTKSKRQTIGYFALVPSSGGVSGGVYLALIFPPSIARTLDNIIP